MQRVLLYRLGSLGDMVVALPAFHLAARAFPNADRRLLTSFPPNAKAPAASAILQNTNLVNGYFRYAYATRNLLEIVALWWNLLLWRPQVLVYMSGSSNVKAARRNQAFFRLCGIRRFIGVPLTEEMQRCQPAPLLTPQWVQGTGISREHESNRLTRNLTELGAINLDAAESWNLHLTSAEFARATEVLAPLAGTPFIAVSLGTKNQANHWGADNWAALLRRIASATMAEAARSLTEPPGFAHSAFPRI